MSRTYDEIQQAIWTDERGMPPATREVALALVHVLNTEPESQDPWGPVGKLMGHEGLSYRSAGKTHVRWRVHTAVAGDAPRYDPGKWSLGSAECEGPRMRPYRPRGEPYLDACLMGHHPHVGTCRYPQVYGGEEHGPGRERDPLVCGASATIRVPERDMVTGWETWHWFCTRHRTRAAEVKAQIDARGKPPEPIPNSGGILPRYFGGDWPAVYAWHCELAGRHWKVPFHGVDADDWPVPGKTLIPKRPRLSLVAS